MRVRQVLAAVSFAFGLASPVMAEGLTLKLEGGLGFTRGANVGIFSLVRTPPATATTQHDYSQGIPRGPVSFSYRAGGSWAHELGNGTKMRVGGILSGQSGTSNETTPVYYIVTAIPGGPDPAPPVSEIRNCSFPNPCAIFEGELSRSYHEVMPELMFGRDAADGAMTWVGLQGFAGRLSEDAANRGYSVPDALFPFDTTTLTEIDADVKGLLLAVQHERPLASGATLVIGAGLGRYQGDATGLSLNPANLASEMPVSGTFDGTRAQLSVGFEKPVGKGMTLGATIRADYWTDQPRIRLDWTEPPCAPSVCDPPTRSGNFDLVTDPVLNLTLGVSLTFRM